MIQWFSEHTIWLNSLTILVLVIASALIGNRLAKALRVVEYGWKFAVILFALAASLVVVYRGWPPKLGIDLGGGAILVYRIDKTKTDWHESKMDSLVSSIAKRVNPGGQKEITVRSLGTDMVQIIMPAVSGSTAKEKQVQAEEIRKIIRTTGALEFLIVATNRDDQTNIEKAKAARKAGWDEKPGPDNTRNQLYRDPDSGQYFKWCLVRDKEKDRMMHDEAAVLLDAGTDANGKPQQRVEVLVLMPVGDPLAPQDSPEWKRYDANHVTGKYIRDARAAMGSESPSPEVHFSFNTAGAVKFGKLTGDHAPLADGFKYRLAIVLDDVLQTAPALQSQISDSGRITGDFSIKEVQDIADIINRGSLPAALNPTPERDMTTEATLGADHIVQSTRAMIIACIAVPLFMMMYYRFAGMVAVLVLSLNMLMLVAVMILVKAPFTLPALAGLALTVGMAVDNNVLIYERLREELSHGAALRMALRNAFHRVGVVIVDANITHILAAAVLFYVGTEQVKGFAITFLLGALLSIWATMFVARVIFEVAERRRWIQRLTMMQWIGHTNIDFMGWFPTAATFSVVITVLGVGIAVVRDRGLFGIDFTGGVSVQTVFKAETDIKAIRTGIGQKEKELPDATVSNSHSQDEPESRRFNIDTSNSNREEVETLIQDLFGKSMVTGQMSYLIVSAAGASPPPGPAAPPEKPKEPKSPPPEPKPAEKAKPAEKPAEAKPAAQPEAKNEAKPAAGAEKKPEPKAETKPAETKPANTSKPAETKAKQSHSDLPSSRLVAMAGSDALLFALADPPAAKATDAKPTAKADDGKPDAKPATKADDAKPQAKDPKPQITAELPAEPVVGKPIDATIDFRVAIAKIVNEDGKDTVKEVPQPAKYERDRVKRMIEQAMADQGIPAEAVEVKLVSPEGSEISDQWRLSLVPTGKAPVSLTPAKVDGILGAVKKVVAEKPYFPGVDNIGSAVAGDTRFWACVALVLSWSLIILYLWFRFQAVAFGLAAVIALIHDVLVMLGAIALSSYMALVPGVTAITLIEPFKIDLTLVAAFLTIIGYSVNDTIIIFDRIREVRGKSPSLTRQMVNDATNQTLGRTVLTSVTVMLVVVIMYIFGGPAVHAFSFALIVGVLTGTYSSIYVAAPILLWLLHPKEMRVETASGQGR